MLVEICVDDVKIMVDDEKNLIDELKKHGIEIPHFCYHEALGVSGNCRMCLIEVVGQKRPQVACDTPIKKDMQIRINSTLTRSVQRGLLELEFINHPLDCPVCDQAGECSLQDYYMLYDLQTSRIDKSMKVKKKKTVHLGSRVVHDEERCVLCRRCVRFTQKITKTNELGVVDRGEHSHIAIFNNEPIHNNYAGNIVDICPVGAMTNADFRFKKRVWFLKSTHAICQLCDSGCAIYVDHHKEKYNQDIIYRIRPRMDEQKNHFICDNSRYSYKKMQALNQDDFNERFERLSDFVKSTKAIILGSDLGLEEMHAFKELSKQLRLDLYGFDDFKQKGDDLSRGENKTPNANGLKRLNISTSAPLDLENALIVSLNFAPQIHRVLRVKKSFLICAKKLTKPNSIMCANAFGRTAHTINSKGILRKTNEVISPFVMRLEQIANRLSVDKIQALRLDDV